MCILVLLQTITVTDNIKYLYRIYIYFHKYKYVKIPYSNPAYIQRIDTDGPGTSARFYFRHKYGRQPVEEQCLYKFTIFPEN